MPIVGDFTVISGKPDAGGRTGDFENPYRIGDNSGDGPFRIHFGTGGLHNSPGLLTFMVRGIPNGRAANVRINGHRIGVLTGTEIEAGQRDRDKVWRYQQFAIPTNVLSGANSNDANRLDIGAIPITSGGAQGDFNDFDVRDIVCYFHQVA